MYSDKTGNRWTAASKLVTSVYHKKGRRKLNVGNNLVINRRMGERVWSVRHFWTLHTANCPATRERPVRELHLHTTPHLTSADPPPVKVAPLEPWLSDPHHFSPLRVAIHRLLQIILLRPELAERLMSSCDRTGPLRPMPLLSAVCFVSVPLIGLRDGRPYRWRTQVAPFGGGIPPPPSTTEAGEGARKFGLI